MTMFRVHYSNNTTLDISAETPEHARAHALKFAKGFRIMTVKRLKEVTCSSRN